MCKDLETQGMTEIESSYDTCSSVDNENFDSIPGCLCHGLNVFLNAKQDLYEM